MSVTFRAKADNSELSNFRIQSNFPAGAAAGDVLLFWVYGYKASPTGTLAIEANQPSKYKPLFVNPTASGKAAFACFYRVMQSGDTTNTLFNFTDGGALTTADVMLVTSMAYSGADPIGYTSVVVSSAVPGTGAHSTIQAPSVTTPWATCKVVAGFAGYAGGVNVSSTPNPAGMTERSDHQDASNLAQMAIDDIEQAAAGASGAMTFTIAVSTITDDASGSVVVRIAAPPVAPTVSATDPAYGPITGGTPITITGTGFVVGASTVDIGGAAATSVVVASVTSLTCVTPARTVGNKAVAVTTTYGTGTLS